MQLENPEEALRLNGMSLNQEAATEPEESQTTVSKHPEEGEVEDVMSYLEQYDKE